MYKCLREEVKRKRLKVKNKELKIKSANKVLRWSIWDWEWLKPNLCEGCKLIVIVWTYSRYCISYISPSPKACRATSTSNFVQVRQIWNLSLTMSNSNNLCAIPHASHSAHQILMSWGVLYCYCVKWDCYHSFYFNHNMESISSGALSYINSFWITIIS